MPFQVVLTLFRDMFRQWSEAKAPRLGAALAFYTVISLAPLLVLLLAFARLIYGPQAAAGELVDEIRGTVGQPVAEAVQDMIRQPLPPASGVLATVGGIVVLLFGASGVFGQLQDALNTIWQVAPRPNRGLWGIIQDRFLSFAMILGTGFLLLASLIVTAMLDALARYWTPATLPGGAWLWQGANLFVGFAIITLLFALIFKILPDAKVRWEDVWIGALGTAFLFTLGKYLLALYLSTAGVASGYGAAGSLVIILLWVYYSSQLLLFGATFTRVYAQHYGSGVKPAPNAVLLTPADRAREGIPTRAQLQEAEAEQAR